MNKSNFSMQSVKTLFRLEIRARFGSTHKIGVKNRVSQFLNLLFSLAVYAILVAGIFYLSKMFVVRSGLRIEFLVMVATGTLIITTIVATSTVIKNLYLSGDNEMLLRFPVSGKEIFVAKSIYCYLHNLFVCAIVMLPFYFVFGVVTDANVGYYFTAIAIMFLSTFIPFFIANIIALPVMALMNAVKNQFLFVLILTIFAICGVFVIYLEALGNVLKYLSTENQNLFSPDMIARYQTFASSAYPFKWFAYLLSGKTHAGLTSGEMGLSFLYIVVINVALGLLSLIVASKVYYKTILNGILNEKVSFKRKTKNVQRTVFGTLLRREFFLIFRSFNYSFQYLAMAVAAPVMVFFCNRLATSLGTKSVGGQIVPGLTLLVIIIFVAIIVSFASTTISREGNAFFHTKVVPVSYLTQIATKFFLYAIVATASVVLCCLVTGLAFCTERGGKLLSVGDIFAIFGISEMVVISLTSLSIWADVVSPTFNVAGDGELVAANKNVAVSLFVGISMAVIYGLFTMIFSFLPLKIGNWVIAQNNMTVIYGLLAGVSAIILACSLSLLFVKINSRYKKIVP